MTTQRIPLSQPIETRDGTLTKDSKSVNGYFETRNDTREFIKRPGNQSINLQGSLPIGTAKGIYSFEYATGMGGESTNSIWAVVDNTLYTIPNYGAAYLLSNPMYANPSLTMPSFTFGFEDFPWYFTALDQSAVGRDVFVHNRGTAAIFNGTSGSFDTTVSAKGIADITILTGGINYASPTITISPPSSFGGVAATAYATVTSGVITDITINGGGSGYTQFDTPIVSISDIGNRVTGYTVTAGGSGYVPPNEATLSVGLKWAPYCNPTLDGSNQVVHGDYLYTYSGICPTVAPVHTSGVVNGYHFAGAAAKGTLLGGGAGGTGAAIVSVVPGVSGNGYVGTPTCYVYDRVMGGTGGGVSCSTHITGGSVTDTWGETWDFHIGDQNYTNPYCVAGKPFLPNTHYNVGDQVVTHWYQDTSSIFGYLTNTNIVQQSLFTCTSAGVTAADGTEPNPSILTPQVNGTAYFTYAGTPATIEALMFDPSYATASSAGYVPLTDAGNIIERLVVVAGGTGYISAPKVTVFDAGRYGHVVSGYANPAVINLPVTGGYINTPTILTSGANLTATDLRYCIGRPWQPYKYYNVGDEVVCPTGTTNIWQRFVCSTAGYSGGGYGITGAEMMPTGQNKWGVYYSGTGPVLNLQDSSGTTIGTCRWDYLYDPGHLSFGLSTAGSVTSVFVVASNSNIYPTSIYPLTVPVYMWSRPEYGYGIGATIVPTVASGPSGSGAAAIAIKNGFPDGPLVHGTVYIDGYTVVGTEAGRLYSSWVGDASRWSSLSYVTAEGEPDGLVGIAKHLNYVVAFGNWSTEFFTDVGNATGSPLAPATSYRLELGCTNGASIQSDEQIVLFVGESRTVGRGIYLLDGTQPNRISTPFIDRICDYSTLTGCRSYLVKIQGHQLYVLTLKDIETTLVYDVDEKIWTTWSSWAQKTTYDPFWGTYTLGDYGEYSYSEAFLTHDNANNIYTLRYSGQAVSVMSRNYYTDNTAPIYYRTVTDIVDSGTTKRKFYNAIEIIGDKIPATMKIRHTSNDYQSWSSWRSVDLSKDRPRLNQLGASRRRAWEFLCTDNQPLRLGAAEVDFKIGEIENEGLQPTQYRK
jgi:hypothetical protein